KLPDFLPTRASGEAVALRATGTDSAGLSPVCTGFVQTVDPACDRTRPDETDASPDAPDEADANPDLVKSLRPDETACDGVRGRGPSRFRTGDSGLAIRCFTTWRGGRRAVLS